MKTEVFFLDSKRMKIEVSTGDEFVLYFPSSLNYQMSKIFPHSLIDGLIKKVFDEVYDGDKDKIINTLSGELIRHNFEMPIMWNYDDLDMERIRIGEKIKELRKEKGLDAKVLAEMTDITPANLCRIEQGKISVGLNILFKIARALDRKIDFVDIKEDMK